LEAALRSVEALHRPRVDRVAGFAPVEDTGILSRFARTDHVEGTVDEAGEARPDLRSNHI